MFFSLAKMDANLNVLSISREEMARKAKALHSSSKSPAQETFKAPQGLVMDVFQPRQTNACCKST
eukprot:scaffold5159_cov80-Skeletonema_dohrnii-CCMP3373.AAC.4